ncbi:MAG: hypothetical protein CM15mP116_07390 [Synechococcus sp.]|nr:MAG: hypothetical protein CM15mP116_07390 [Synechococcus sp.]
MVFNWFERQAEESPTPEPTPTPAPTPEPTAGGTDAPRFSSAGADSSSSSH